MNSPKLQYFEIEQHFYLYFIGSSLVLFAKLVISTYITELGELLNEEGTRMVRSKLSNQGSRSQRILKSCYGLDSGC
jgi:hypothetical protein